jgi:hypothetical protein
VGKRMREERNGGGKRNFRMKGIVLEETKTTSTISFLGWMINDKGRPGYHPLPSTLKRISLATIPYPQ